MDLLRNELDSKELPLCLGTWGLSGPLSIGNGSYGWRSTSERESLGILDYAYCSGVRIYDTASVYGSGYGEILTGKSVGKKADAFIATKIGLVPEIDYMDGGIRRDYSPSHLQKSLDASLKRLKRDYIDLLYLHGPTIQIAKSESISEFISSAKRLGKIRYSGCSIGKQDTMSLESWFKLPYFDALQVPCSIAEPIGLIQAKATIAQKPLFARSIFLHGLLLKQIEFRLDSKEYKDDFRSHLFNQELLRRIHSFWLSQKESNLLKIDTCLFPLLRSEVIQYCVVGATSVRQLEELISSFHRYNDLEDYEIDQILTNAVCMRNVKIC